MNNLNEQFIYELLKLCLKKKEVLEVCRVHLKYQFLPTQALKKVFKTTLDYYLANGNSLPSLGYVAQSNNQDSEVMSAINEIKLADLQEVDDILHQLEEFIKRSKFLEAYDSLADVYNSGDKEKAYSLLSSVGKEINNFKIRENTDFFDKIYQGFEGRHRDRVIHSKEESHFQKVPFGIDELDAHTHGGIDEGDTALFLGQSGSGKTKLLRWIGVSASRRGFKVAHVQAEGTRDEALAGYDATWTGVKMVDLKRGSIPEDVFNKIIKAKKNINHQGGEIYIHAYEKFNTATVFEVRDMISQLFDIYGKVDLVLMDYFELFDPGDGRKYEVGQERERRRKIGRMLKDLAVEFKTRIVTATQASDVHPDLLNDPDFVMTRHNVSEFKNVAEPFSYFITINQTSDEYKNKMVRLYCDKLRNYKSKQVVRIYQSLAYDRFYDRKRTLQELG